MVDPTPTADIANLTQGALLNRMTDRIRRSLELQQILAATVTEVRSFLGTDRVKIYRFQPDGSGQVIAESLDPTRLPPLQGLYFPATDIPPAARELFVKARQRSIIDVASQSITLSRLDRPLTTADLTVDDVHAFQLQDILRRPVDPCHVQYLTAMGVQSSLVIPIMHGRNLWGLLASHHATPIQFSEQKLEIVQLVANQVSIAIAQSNLLSQTRDRAHRESVINQISTLLHSPLPIDEILQTVLERIVEVLGCSVGRLYLFTTSVRSAAQLYSVGPQPFPTTPVLEATHYWQGLTAQAEAGDRSAPITVDQSVLAQFVEGDLLNYGVVGSYPQAIADLYQEPLLAEHYDVFRSTRLRSLLVMPLFHGDLFLGFLSLFRDEVDTDIVWAGKFDPDDRHQPVRESFAAWRELCHGQAQPWTADEIELVRSLGTHLVMAVMQICLYACEREQRLLVEMRNQELNTARSAAEETSRLKSNFLASTSHELRTPLALTLNYLKLLKDGFYDNPEELQEYIDVAHHSAESLVAIINDVLDIAKIEAGRMQVHWERVNLPAMLHSQEDLFRPESREKGIALVVDCQVQDVWADALKLRQILTNLLANAFKFTTEGEIRVSAVRRSLVPPDPLASIVEIAISDTGIGIDPHHEDSLFEPFVQADGSIKRRYGGTGLGLTICRQLVELMGGQIRLESPGQGQGTVATFFLPDRSPDQKMG